MIKHFIIFGPPGSGKGTQARRLVKRFGFVYLGTGDLLRLEATKKTPFGEKAKELLEKGGGGLLNDLETNKMVDEHLAKTNPELNIIFDGYPRTIPQAKHLSEYFEKIKSRNFVLNLNVSEQALINRTLTRRICEKCHKPFQNPEQLKIKVCPDCGGNLIVRSDDKPEIIKNRLKVYTEQTAPLLDYYRTKAKIIQIDGEPPIDEVWDEIETKVEKILVQA